MKVLLLLRAPWFVCLLAATGLSLESDDVKYIPLGGVLELLPDTKPITGVLWKHGPNKASEWDEGFGPDVDYYGTYRNRTKLIKETGKLVVNNMTIEHSGEYSVEVDSQLQSKTYMVKVVKKVPKPSVDIKPLVQSTSCTLVCEGGDITDSGPVTYRWKKDGGEWMVSDSGQNSKQMNIVNDEDGKKVRDLFCEMKNPVSAEQSDATGNPFYKGPTSMGAIVGGIVGGVIGALILAVLVVV